MTVDTRAGREHACDADCADWLDETNTCTVCGTYHGDPCPDCGGRGYHSADCNHVDEET
jgi:hypothetical protein